MPGCVGRMVLISLTIAVGGVAAGDDPSTLVARAKSLRSEKQFPAAIELLQRAAALEPSSSRIPLMLAETLGWDRRFIEAEHVYRGVLQRHPDSVEASAGLARTLLWEGRHAEARARFQGLTRRRSSDLDAAEGAATAAYWAGDWTRAQREFAAIVRRDPQRQFARQSLAEIAEATRPEQSAASEGVDDDQPFRSLRLEASETFHTDPLTRWSVAAGAYAFQNRRLGRDWSSPFLRVSHRLVLPWHRLRIDSSLGVLRYGDGVTRPVGGVAVRRSMGATWEWSGSLERRELVATATAQAFHPAVTSLALGWRRDGGPHRVLAAADAGRLRYDDHNRGWFAQGYALFPVARRDAISIAAGVSVAARDTSESRFFADAVASKRAIDGSFVYAYSGSYTPYWTPQRLREVRGIINVSALLPRASALTLHADGGIADDVAEAFGPGVGPGPLPARIATYDFDRRFHPWRASATFSTRLNESTRVEFGVERGATAFYRARTFRAALVRRR